jgi:hypothetical protein
VAKSPEEEPRLSDEQAQAMMPMVLELQRLIQSRMRQTLRPGEELGIISLTSCTNNSCN